MTECNQSGFGFEACGKREIVARFDGGTISSDGGAFLLRQTDKRLNLLPRLAECFLDGRNQDQVEHSILEMLSQRIYGLALGYEDLNDHEQLRKDPVFGILAGREEVDEPLARQRFIHFLPSCQNAENRVLPQLLVVVEILIAQRQTVDPLGEHLENRVLDLVLIPAVEKTFRQARQQIQALVGLSQQECPAIGTYRSAVESRHDLPLPAGFKSEPRLVTLCHSEGRPLFGSNWCVETQLCHEGRPFANYA